MQCTVRYSEDTCEDGGCEEGSYEYVRACEYDECYCAPEEDTARGSGVMMLSVKKGRRATDAEAIDIWELLGSST
jgi:hypothetical protein